MSSQSWVETLVASEVDGAQLVSSVTATSLLPAQAKVTLRAGLLNAIGKKLRIKGTARVSNLNPTPGNFTLDLRLGGTVVFTSGAMALNTSQANTNTTTEFEVNLTVRADGSAATLFPGGWIMGLPFGTAAVVGQQMFPASAPAVGTSFDATAAQQLDLFGTFSVSNAANAITLHQFSVELIN